MNALVVSVLLFLVYTTLGLGVTAILPASYPAATRLRLAPGVGIGLLLVFAVALSRAGLPVRSFVYPLGAILLGLAIAAIVMRPPRPSRADVFALALPLVLAIVLVGSPMTAFHFHWLSYSNDDMANYSLSAQRFEESGYFTPPPDGTLSEGRDLAQESWGSVAIVGERAGVDLILACASSALRQNPFQMFMPVILSAFFVVVVASGALGLPAAGELIPTLISSAVAASSLAGFGVFYQLLGQEFGLGCLCTLTALLLPPVALYRDRRDVLRCAFVAGVAACGLTAAYPELLPFAGLSFLLYLVTRWRRLDGWNVLLGAGVASATAFTLLNGQALSMLLLIQARVTKSAAVESVVQTLFPYYLIPSGVSNLWGLQPIATFYQDPLQSVLIACGLLLTALALVMALWLLFRSDTPAAPMLCAMALFYGFAFHVREAFALYKMAMYVQPFLIPVCVSGIALLATRNDRLSWRARAIPVVAATVLLAAIGLPAQGAYRNASADVLASQGSSFTEIPAASRDAILTQLRALSQRTGRSDIVVDTSNVSLAKVEAGYFRDARMFFYITDAIDKPLTKRGSTPPFWDLAFQRRLDIANRIDLRRKRQRSRSTFDYMPGTDQHLLAKFVVDRRIHAEMAGGKGPYFLMSTERQTIFNRRSPISHADADLNILPFNSVSDHLTFLDTDRGIAIGTGDATGAANRELVSVFQLERDPYFALHTMASVGRYLLFALDGSKQPVRIVLDLTATLNGAGHNSLPPVMAVGTRRVSFHAVGQGSARLVSDPVVPAVVAGVSLVGIDMGRPGTTFPDRRTGLMRLYGDDVPLDSRKVAGFARDISAVAANAPPRAIPNEIAQFPADLGNPDLFYSGIYEDGWVGQDARVSLTSAGTAGDLRLTMMIPLIANPGFASSVTLSVDGTPVGTWPEPLGRSTIDVPVNGMLGPHTVRLHFSRAQYLPDPDSRAVAARIEYLGFL
jgi:hypothetical protein